VNVYHYTMMAKVFLPKLVKERPKHQSAFIAVSSCSCLRYMPSFLEYSATKAFATHLTLAVKQEIASNKLIELQTVVPAATNTNVVEDPRMAWVGTPTPKAVGAFLDQLANGYTYTFGTGWNEFLARLWWGWCGRHWGSLFDYMMTLAGRLVEH
jgi:short-subunit dehydrogenase